MRLPSRSWIWLGASVLWIAAIAQAGPYDTWAKYKTLTVNTTNTGGGANVSTTQTNYPVLIRLTNFFASDILSGALSGGADVRFSSSDGSTALSYQIEDWTNSTSADIWVLVPSVAGNSTTDIRIYWGKSGQSDASSASSVFSTSNSFIGVWHLGETGSNSVGNYRDATGIYNDSAAGGMTNAGAGQVAGVIGNGTAFDGSASYLGFGPWPGSASSQTVSFWMKATSLANQEIVDKNPNDASGVGWTFKARSDGSMWYRVGSESNAKDWQKSGAYSAGTWVYIMGTYSGGTQTLYINGTSAGTANTSVTQTVNNNTTYLRFGIPSAANTTEIFNGSLDEVQISSSSRSADWAKLNYQTQVAGATPVLYGSTQGNTYYWNRNDVLTSSTDFSKAYNWTGNADGTGRRPASTTDDDFSSTTLGGSWTCQDADNNAGTGTCDQTTKYGRLTIQGRGSELWQTTNEFTALRRADITGDFDVTVRVDSVYNTNTAAKAGIYMANDFTVLGPGTANNSGGYAGIAVRGDLKLEFEASTTTAGQLASIGISGSAVTLPVWLRLVKSGSSVSAYYRTSLASTWTQQNTTQTVVSTNANSQIGLLLCSHNSGLTGVAVFDEFQGGTAISSTGLNLSFNGSGSNANANATMSASQAAASIDFTGYTGTFNFGSYTLTINTGNATFVSGQTVTAGTGTLAFTGNSGTQTFTPKSGATFPAITKSGSSGTVAVATNALTAGAFTLTSGTWQWGSGFTHSVTSISTAAGTMDFGSSTVQVTSGNADLSNLGTLTVGTGTLAFTAGSGTQTFTPNSGATHPNISHTGAGTLQLSTNALTCLSFTQSAGILNFNGQNISTTSSGNFTVTNGATTSFSNLNGRTLTVAGNASFTGQSGNLLDMNATAWTLTVAGALSANYANIAGSNAGGGSTGAADNSTNGGANTNWTFDYSAWAYSTAINFNTTSTGANTSTNITNYPMLVRLDSNNFIFSQAKTDGSDIRFTDPDGTVLSYSIEKWDYTNKKAWLWVKVPQVDANSNTDYIKMYWGRPSASSQSSDASVFGSYVGVYHLQQSPGGTAPQFTDASGNGNNGTAQGGVTGDSVSADISYGYKLDGSSKYVSTTTQFSNPNTFTI